MESRSDNLESRLRELQDAGQRLQTEVSDLRNLVSPPSQVNRVGHLSEAPNRAVLTKDDWQTLVDEVGELKALGDIAEDRMAQLEGQREALLEKIKALNLQQVRNDQEIRQIRKQSKRLILLVATAGLLAAGFLTWLVNQA